MWYQQSPFRLKRFIASPEQVSRMANRKVGGRPLHINSPPIELFLLILTPAPVTKFPLTPTNLAVGLRGNETPPPIFAEVPQKPSILDSTRPAPSLCCRSEDLAKTKARMPDTRRAGASNFKNEDPRVLRHAVVLQISEDDAKQVLDVAFGAGPRWSVLDAGCSPRALRFFNWLAEWTARPSTSVFHQPLRSSLLVDRRRQESTWLEWHG
jgi:hypothetical protein